MIWRNDIYSRRTTIERMIDKSPSGHRWAVMTLVTLGTMLLAISGVAMVDAQSVAATTTAINGQVAAGEGTLAVEGIITETGSDQVVVVYIGARGGTHTEVVQTSRGGLFESRAFDPVAAGFGRGVIQIIIIAPGADGTLGWDGESPAGFADRISADTSSQTQAQIREIVEEAASFDETYYQTEVQVRAPMMRVSEVVVAEDGPITVRGETNLPRGSTHELSIMRETGPPRPITQFDQWGADGAWQVRFPRPTDGRYELSVSNLERSVDAYQFTVGAVTPLATPSPPSDDQAPPATSEEDAEDPPSPLGERIGAIAGKDIDRGAGTTERADTTWSIVAVILGVLTVAGTLAYTRRRPTKENEDD